MAREQLPYFDPATEGNGLEGLINWANISMDYWLVPSFLIIFYGLAIYISTKNEYQLGAQVALVSFLFFLLGMIAQTYTQFNQIVMFIFVIGIIVGLIMTFIENAR